MLYRQLTPSWRAYCRTKSHSTQFQKGTSMLRFCTLACLLLACASSLHAASETMRRNVGVGLGTMIFGENDGLLSQVLAATTNGLFGNQTFAITSGTSGAEPFDGIVVRRKMEVFVADNMDALARDIAAGRGETIGTLAELMAIPAEEHSAFVFTLQRNFDQIFPEATVTNEVVVDNILQVFPVEEAPAQV